MDISSIGGTMPLPTVHAPPQSGTTPTGTPVSTPASAAEIKSPGVGKAALTTVQGKDPADPTTPEGIQQALEEVQTALSPVARDLRFSIDDDTGTTVVKIVDTATDEVIKQIPSEEILRIAKALDKLQGLLVRQSV